MVKGKILKTEIWVPVQQREVFDFFSNAENLGILTPEWLNFEILSDLPIEMRAGALIDYQLRFSGFPIRWRTEITEWNPPLNFTDVQLKGPYSYWRHRHFFREMDQGTLIEDLVEYLTPGGIISPIVHKLFVEQNLERIFSYRKRKISELFV